MLCSLLNYFCTLHHCICSRRLSKFKLIEKLFKEWQMATILGRISQFNVEMQWELFKLIYDSAYEIMTKTMLDISVLKRYFFFMWAYFVLNLKFKLLYSVHFYLCSIILLVKYIHTHIYAPIKHDLLYMKKCVRMCEILPVTL